MDIRKFVKALGRKMTIVCALCLLSTPLMAGSNEYACRVETVGGQPGVVLVQSDTKQKAAQAAKGKTAFTIDNGHGTATSVAECIDRSKEQFSDYQLQQFLESIPL